MAKPVAHEFDYIRAKLAEIEAERAAARNRACGNCNGVGWAWHSTKTHMITCPACENPAGKPKP